jgi:O-antigen ligase
VLSSLWIFFAGVYLLQALLWPRAAFLFFMFMLAFSPRYFAIGVGASELAFTFQRFMAIVLAMVVIGRLLVSRDAVTRVAVLVKESKLIIFSIVGLFLWKLLATVSATGLANIAYFFDDLLLSASVLLAAMVFVRTPRELLVTLSVVVASLFASELLGVVEYLRAAPFAKGAEVSVELSPDALKGSFRGSAYRIMVGFTNPLLLAEFLLPAFAAAVMVVGTRRGKWRVLGVVSLLLIFPTMLMTGSRAGVLTLALAIYVYAIFFFWRRFGRAGRFAMLVGLLFSLGVLLDTAGLVLFNPGEYFSRRDLGGLSVLVRIQQYFDIGRLIADHPWLGFGLMQNYETGVVGVTHLDSYWLRLGLEGGVPAMMLFATLLIGAIAKSTLLFLKLRDPLARLMAASFATYFLTVAVYKLFVSIPTNNAYLFALVGMTSVFAQMARQPVRSPQPLPAKSRVSNVGI